MTTAAFRRHLASRLLQVTALSSAAATLGLGVGCGGSGIASGEASGGVGGGGGASGQGGHGGFGGTDDSSGWTVGPSTAGPVTTTTGSTTSVSSGPYPETSCFAWPEGPTCPTKDEAYQYIGFLGCGGEILTEGKHDGMGSCCYEVISYTDCAAGRPFLVDRRPLAARARRAPGKGWSSRGAAAPACGSVSPSLRATLRDAWTRDALLEHASVASFARFGLELMAVGAPSDLIAAAHQAALDEIAHAELCFALASGYAGEPIEPGAFPLGAAVPVCTDLPALAASTVREGCIGETLAALQAAAQLERAVDPAVRAALAVIARDEARHAELAWRAVAWAIEEGGEAVRRAVAEAFAEAERSAAEPVAIAPAPDADELAAHGRLDASRTRAEATLALREVVLPCARRLLERDAAPSPRDGRLSTS